jgi:hypothetical protein
MYTLRDSLKCLQKGIATMTNRLSKEKSSYLLQHKNNPVDWYPWGTEAFNKAESENKPIFLSVGYSTCHWYCIEFYSDVGATLWKRKALRMKK